MSPHLQYNHHTVQSELEHLFTHYSIKMSHPFFHMSTHARKSSFFSLLLVVLVTTSVLLRYNPIYNPIKLNNYKQFPIENSKNPITPSTGPLIPSSIWQIFLPYNGHTGGPLTIDPSQLVDTASWLAKNPDYHYMLVASKWADNFVDEHFAASHPKLAQTYHALKNPGLKSDLLRYLILSVEGGVYTDIDTVALKPIDEWVAPDIKDKVRLVVGIEFDQRDGGMWSEIPHPLQFCQWTIAAAPGHPIFMAMAARALDSLEFLRDEVYKTEMENLKPTSFEVMNSTGPAAWTDVLFSQLQLADPSLTDLRDLGWMTGPRLYGDILVLHIDGFGMGQAHSGSTNDGTFPDGALVKHNFRGSWRNREGA